MRGPDGVRHGSRLRLAPLVLLAAGACARPVLVDAPPPDPIVVDRAAPVESVVVVLPQRCIGVPATHLFHGAIVALDSGSRMDSTRMVALLARLTESLALPVGLMHAPVLGEVLFTIGRDGTVRRFEARALRQDAAFTRAVARVLEVLRFPGALDSLGVDADSLTLFVTYETGSGVPIGHVVAFRAAPPTARAAVRPGTAVAPRYPLERWESGEEGMATVRFIVDGDGGVDPRGVLVTATDRAFARAVLDALPRYAFEPARVGACHVASHLELPFHFRLRE
jgi:TonB family protein